MIGGATLRGPALGDDCGQDGPCATAPGCARHWAERNAELVRERDEARAALAAAECALLTARATEERLRLGRAELEGMRRAAVEEVERLRKLRPALEAVLRMVPPPMPGHSRASRVTLAVDFLRDAYGAIWGAP